jgi:hypothetical protein
MEPLKDIGWAMNQMIWEEKSVTREGEDQPKFSLERTTETVDGEDKLLSQRILQTNSDGTVEEATLTSSFLLATDWKVVEA